VFWRVWSWVRSWKGTGVGGRMSRAMRRQEYKGKKMEYIRKDAISHILAKMTRWGITTGMLKSAIERIKNE